MLVRGGRGPAERELLAIEDREASVDFRDFNPLVLQHLRDVLLRAAGRPRDVDIDDAGVGAQADVLLKRRGAERSAAADGAVDRSNALARVLDGHGDTRTYCGAIRLR